MNGSPDDTDVSVYMRVWEWVGVGVLVIVVIPIVMTMFLGSVALVGSALSFVVLMFFAGWDVLLLTRMRHGSTMDGSSGGEGI